MIPKAEILEIAKSTGLLPNTIEKDYVISWLLTGISKHPQLSSWFFKGGTCLKKCYFETYRFSEDLDFTLSDDMPYNIKAFHAAFIECTRYISEETGIEFPEEKIEFKESFNKAGLVTFQGKISYKGLLQPNVITLPRIKIDITKHEVIVEPPSKRQIHHTYSDRSESHSLINCYSINEILAEKTRAIFERKGRARDIYDVVNLGRNFKEEIDAEKAFAVLVSKFSYKELPTPSIKTILDRVDFQVLAVNWDNQLKHQLPFLPPIESYINGLEEESLWWIEPERTIPELPNISNNVNEESIQKNNFPDLYIEDITGITKIANFKISYGSFLEKVQYAARNRLCVIITYDNVKRLVEPYSLRIKSTGNLLLYVYEQLRSGYPSDQLKGFILSKIQNVELTSNIFRPKWVVEF